MYSYYQGLFVGFIIGKNANLIILMFFHGNTCNDIVYLMYISQSMKMMLVN